MLLMGFISILLVGTYCGWRWHLDNWHMWQYIRTQDATLMTTTPRQHQRNSWRRLRELSPMLRYLSWGHRVAQGLLAGLFGGVVVVFISSQTSPTDLVMLLLMSISLVLVEAVLAWYRQQLFYQLQRRYTSQQLKLPALFVQQRLRHQAGLALCLVGLLVLMTLVTSNRPWSIVAVSQQLNHWLMVAMVS
ncbi:hypothetical protein [Lactiplantibacillus fabifermentans]|uniref:Uncharacterized protein n=2 Tax=Lactiplantibacillus fabifermentans TaxID=483011 RepID=A0A0R2NWT4_9LACO|nr:hypothetical protein [Lactiplantibacillus fabifermentans]ETY75123.1 hypothetical protein LFAB_03620 [Lactiplantibacillus fabifermentans T30PCM01]KRO28891.1 hypothetical protein DY78_GL001880 [Lactiplantibacillus fabifermentans DSM 21115]